MAVVVNPFSKILVTALMPKHFKKKSDIRDIINYSNLVALTLLLFFALFGPLIFKELLGISDAALLLACGLSLAIFGINYLFKEEVFEFKGKPKNVMYLSIGTPLIVGPASISTITLISSYSTITYSLLVGLSAILVNYLLMVLAFKFTPSTEGNERLNYLNTRLTGLFMLAVGIQFVINGVNTWLNF